MWGEWRSMVFAPEYVYELYSQKSYNNLITIALGYTQDQLKNSKNDNNWFPKDWRNNRQSSKVSS